MSTPQNSQPATRQESPATAIEPNGFIHTEPQSPRENNGLPAHDLSSFESLTTPDPSRLYDDVPLRVRETWTKWEKGFLTDSNDVYHSISEPLFERAPLPQQIQEELFAHIRQGGPEADEAFKTLVETNLRLIRYHALSMRARTTTNLELEDLVQEGVKGLHDAIQTFDSAKGTFSTHATWRIKGSMREALRSRGDTVHVPAHLNLVAWRVLRTAEDLHSSIGRDPTYSEIAIAAESSTSKPKITSALIADLFALGILRTCPAEASEPREHAHQFIPDTNNALERVTLDEEIARAIELFKECSADFSDREHQILSMRYPLDPEVPQPTLQEVSYHFGLTRQRIQQIETSCLKTLRWRLERKGVSLDLLSSIYPAAEQYAEPKKRLINSARD